jgi:DNA-binding transcriptional LysR family regulator
MRFDLVDLRLFLRVAETESITHGAAKANMALASASGRIRGMEETLGAALLERGRRGVRLTPAGRALVHHARLVAQQIEQMQGELATFAGGLKGHIRMMANTSAFSEFLPEALGSFLATHQGIDVDIEERLSYEIVRCVAEGSADIGIVADTVDFAGLTAFPFAADHLVLVMPRAHALARQRRVAFRDLLDLEFVGMGATNALQQHIGQHALQAGRPLKLRVRLSSFDGICRMVENGVGLAIIPETAARRCRKTMAIRIARLSDSWSLRHLHVCIRSLEALPLYAQELVRHLQQRGGAQRDSSSNVSSN